MKKIVIDTYGASNLMKILEADDLNNPKEDEIIIDVKYSGINFADVVMRIGLYKDAPPRPFVPGYEVSGVVSKVGSKISHVKPGDNVLAGTRFGGYASQVIAKDYQVIPIPSHLDLKEAAAIPVNFVTAYICLVEVARLRPNDKVMIDCATGGVGSIALQILKEIGCETIGLTGNPRKKESITQYGAQAMTREEFENSNEKNFKFILNSSGSRSEIDDQKKRLQLGGHLLCLGVSSAIENGKKSWTKLIKTLIRVPRFNLFNFMMGNFSISGVNALYYFDDPKWVKIAMQEIVKWNKLKPNVGAIYNYKNIAQAHSDLEQGKAIGKILIDWES